MNNRSAATKASLLDFITLKYFQIYNNKELVCVCSE